MLKKILLSLLLLLLIGGASAYLYFTAGSEDYPEVLSPGQLAPEFTARDQRGQSLSLSELTRKGPVVIVFYRGLWCPACQQHLSELQAALDQFVDKGATVMAITPELPEKTLENVPASSISIIHDEGNTIMEAFRVGYQLGKGSQRLLNVMDIDLATANGNDQNTIPIPAIYLINQAGEISFSYEKAGGLVPSYLPVNDILDKLSE